MSPLLDATDHELMLQVGSGHTDRLALLFERHHRRLFGFFVRLGHSRSASEDLVQETFLRALRYAGTYRDTGAFLPWLYQVARNAASDALERGRHERGFTEGEADKLPAGGGQEPESVLHAEELETRLRRALARLPRDKRELVLLSRVREFDTAALAQMFACSTTLVRVRLHRSLRELREYFDDETQT